ncbi:flavin monoamine oxidase family protein [Candidatus Protochlamydia phocaeensis]|uniref:flavin monoamine oxidase family protein n=1 Tax=Candidatus Protochlamydia phocaeensis TaxID=1414722 RepID=UPI0008390D23|nr:NAD(P)/FAD-dependent oxidoreductase [Candidatus Protochlamydia phocaeensis]
MIFNSLCLFTMALLTASSLFAHSESKPKVAVIGAGLAGLTAAYRLQEKGFHVGLYEARSRVGGRVLTVEVDGHLAELGGQNILDGGEAKHLLALIEELGLKTERRQLLSHLRYVEEGKILDMKEILEARHFDRQELGSALQSIGQTAKNMQEVLQALFKEEDALYKICRTMLAGYEGAPAEKLSPLYIETLYHILTGGISAAHQSKEETNPIIEQLVVEGGNSLIAEKLADKLSSCLHLNHSIQTISKTASGAYRLAFANGNMVEADLLVLALPCSVYDSLRIGEEVIPSSRRLAIEGVEYGTNAKVILPVSPSHIEKGAYTNGRIVTFMNRNEHVLNLYYIGGYGHFTEESLKARMKQDFAFIECAYEVEIEVPPILASDQPFASYKGLIGYSWPNDPFAKGSYSCIGAGQEEAMSSLVEVAGEKVRKLFAPIDNSLFFAGEHTSILFEVGGTMEAAVESGERTARLIAQLISQPLKNP